MDTLAHALSYFNDMHFNALTFQQNRDVQGGQTKPPVFQQNCVQRGISLPPIPLPCILSCDLNIVKDIK